MSDELVIDNQPTITNEYDSFDGSPAPIEEKVITTPDAKTEPPKSDEPIVETTITEPPVEDGRNFLKEKLGYEDWDSVKAEIETLKTKAQSSEAKYEPLEPTKIKELYAIVDKKEKLEQLTTGEITKDNAGAIIKAAMIEKYKGLSPEMVNHKFNKSFSIPSKPVEDSFVDTTDFEIAQNEWKEKVADIEMEMMIEANLVRPELEKIKETLILPALEKSSSTDVQPTPEELAKEQQEKDAFFQFASEAIKKFEGFNVTYKNNDVDVQTTYALSDEEKTSVLGKMKLLAEKNFNSNAVFAERWVNDDMTFNYSQIAKDLAILETNDKSSQKFVSDTAAKVKEQYLRAKHNTDLGKPAGGDLQLADKTTEQKMEAALWS